MTLVGVVITIIYTTSQYKDQDRKRIQPYLTIQQLYKTANKNDVANFTNDDYQIRIIMSLGEKNYSGKDIYFKELEFHEKIKNIGLGTATNIRLENIQIESRLLKRTTNTYDALQTAGNINFNLTLLDIVLEEEMLSKKYKSMKNSSHEIPEIYIKFNISFFDMLENKYIQECKIKVQISERKDGSLIQNVLYKGISHP